MPIGRRSVSLAVAFMAVLALPNCAQGPQGPLAPLAGFGEALEERLNAVIEGGDSSAVFPPFAGSVGEGLWSDLFEAGVLSAELIGMEFELVFFRGGRPFYYLRTFVHPGDGTFLNFAGRRDSASGVPVSEYVGVAAPLGEAAEAFVAAIAAGDCSEFRATELSTLRRYVAENDWDELPDRVQETSANLETECATLSSLNADEVQLRVDDVAFAAFGPNGVYRGIITAGLRLSDAGLVFSVFRYEQ